MLSFPKEQDMMVHREHRTCAHILSVLFPSRGVVHQAYTLQRQNHGILAKVTSFCVYLSTAHNPNSFGPPCWNTTTNNKEAHTHGFEVWSEVSDSRSLFTPGKLNTMKRPGGMKSYHISPAEALATNRTMDQ